MPPWDRLRQPFRLVEDEPYPIGVDLLIAGDVCAVFDLARRQVEEGGMLDHRPPMLGDEEAFAPMAIPFVMREEVILDPLAVEENTIVSCSAGTGLVLGWALDFGPLTMVCTLQESPPRFLRVRTR
jgi:hypothetical protein